MIHREQDARRHESSAADQFKSEGVRPEYRNGEICMVPDESLLHRHLRMEAAESRENVVERRLIALEQRPVCQHTGDTSREYYEQKIEEMSGKWQHSSELLDISRNERRIQADTISDQAQTIMAYLKERGQLVEANGLMADTISELREQLAVKTEVAEAAKELITELREKVDDRDALIGEKNRELEQKTADIILYRQREGQEFTKHHEDAKLGALVRQMPDCSKIEQGNGVFWVDVCMGLPDDRKWAKEVKGILNNE